MLMGEGMAAEEETAKDWVEERERDNDLSYIRAHKHLNKKGDYIRAMYYPREDTEEKFAFQCKTPLKLILFLLDKEYYRDCLKKDQPEEGEFLWIRSGVYIGWKYKALSRKGLYSGKIAAKNAGREFSQFRTFYREGEYITCPVKHTMGQDSVAVKIGPSAWVAVSDDDLMREIHEENPHGEYIFRVTKIDRTKSGPGDIELKYVPYPEHTGNGARIQ